MHKTLFCFFITFFHLRASHYGCVKSAICNSAHPFLSFTAGAVTDDVEVFLFFMSLKSAGTAGYSGNILLHLSCVTQIKVNMFPYPVFDAQGIRQFAAH